jgi:voltage-gated potassium channel
VPFFEGLGAGLIAEVARLLKPRKFYEGTSIMRAGEPGDCMYFIVSGQVTVQLAQPLTIADGSFIGEMALISGAPRTATVTAATDCELLELDLADFRDLAARHPELTTAIVAEAEKRSGR